jgi:hypothetical protein
MLNEFELLSQSDRKRKNKKSFLKDLISRPTEESKPYIQQLVPHVIRLQLPTNMHENAYRLKFRAEYERSIGKLFERRLVINIP